LAVPPEIFSLPPALTTVVQSGSYEDIVLF